jgi:uncharacterized membrane protein
MVTYFVLKYLHIIGAVVLLGTGAGIAFFMLMARRTNDARLVAGVAHIVVIADFVFTLTAVVLQPITGALLVWWVGYSLWAGWILLSLALYVVIGLCWLPVVAQAGTPLPAAYRALFRRWVMLGIPAFAAVLGILWLMIARPKLGF